MNELNISNETARKILMGLEGDSRLKKWSIDFIKEHLDYNNRKHKMWTLAKEWMQQFVREKCWDDEKFAHRKESLMKEWGNKGDAINDEVNYMMEGMTVALHWEEKAQIVVWNRFYHNGPRWPMEITDIPEMLGYINEHLND